MYNNYNPYYGQNRFQMPMYQSAQPIQQITPSGLQFGQQSGLQSGLQGKSVDSIDVVKATDIPMDGSVSYFPLADGSAIVTKQLGVDGVSRIVVFKPENEQKSVSKYITPEDLEKALDEFDLGELDDVKNEIKEIKRQLRELQAKKSKDKEG